MTATTTSRSHSTRKPRIKKNTPHFGENQNLNADQALYGFRNMFKTLMTRTKSPAETFREFTNEEIESEELSSRNAMMGTFIELVSGLLAIVFALALVPNVFEFVSIQFREGSTRIVCWVILFMFLVGMYLVLRTLTIVNYEYANLMDVFRKSRKCSAENKKKIHFYELLPAAQYGIVFDKLDAVFRVAKDGGAIHHDSMADVLMIKNVTQDELPNFLANSMTMVGLIGTIVGLTSATSGMEELFSSIGDIQSLKDGFQTTLAGIDVAFFTTLFGAVGMLSLKYFNIIARKARAVFLGELEQVVLTEILPKVPKLVFTEPRSIKASKRSRK